MTSTASRRGPWEAALERLAAPVPADLFRWFRVSFALKLFLVAVVRHGTSDLASLILLAVLAAAVVNMGARRRYLPGAVVFALYSLWVVVSRWPFPINHHFFEALVTWVLVVLPAPEGEPGEGKADGLAVHVLQYAILSLFVFSGLQKVVHGYYLSGELFTLHALYIPDYLGDRLRDVLQLVGGVLGEGLEPYLGWEGAYAGEPVTVPPWILRTLLPLGAGVLLMEIGAPLLVAWRRTRPFGLVLLILLQVAIALGSYELGIAFVSLNCILLFLRRGYRVGYLLIMAAQAAFYVAVILDPGLL